MTSIKLPDSLWMSPGYGKMFQGFQDLMKFRIRNILLVSSLYDLYLFEEDGRLYELIREEYRGLNLSHAPELTRVSSGMEALRLAKESVNQTLEAQGQLTALKAAFSIQHLAHAHNRVRFGIPVDPGGLT